MVFKVVTRDVDFGVDVVVGLEAIDVVKELAIDDTPMLFE